MQATHGLADLFRLRARVIGLAMAVALTLSALLLGLASSAKAAEPPHKVYLGLGNSIAFGYSKELFNENFSGEDPHRFEAAVPKIEREGEVTEKSNIVKGLFSTYGIQPKFGANIGATVQGTKIPGGTTVVKVFPPAPGDTSHEIELSNAVEGTGSATVTENLTFTSKAPNGYVLDYLLKLKAKQTKLSQWNPAINDGCPGETTDSFIGNGRTGKELETQFPGTHGSAPCAYKYVTKFHLHHEYKGPNAERPSGQSQLENTLEVLQHENTGGNLNKHPVVLITLDIGANDVLNRKAQCEKEVAEGVFTEPPGGTPEEKVKLCIEAAAGPLFNHVLTNLAGILKAIRQGSTFCKDDCDADANDHGVNYTGKIIVQGFYNPFGAVFVPGMELLNGSNLLDLLLNAHAKATANAFGACYANPQSDPAGAPLFARAFNPSVDGMPAPEPERLQAWTNMGNFTFAAKGNKAKNGPDIHPTPPGYEELANIMEDECP
jgi:hypothetical protein